jgi:hypothetical protein
MNKLIIPLTKASLALVRSLRSCRPEYAKAKRNAEPKQKPQGKNFVNLTTKKGEKNSFSKSHR